MSQKARLRKSMNVLESPNFDFAVHQFLLLPAAVNRFTAAFKFWGFLLAAAEFSGPDRVWTSWQLH